MSVRVIQGDCLAEVGRLGADSVDAIVTDPPYHLSSIVKRFGAPGAKPVKAQEGAAGVFARSSAGFMGAQWDGGDVAFRADTWQAFSRVLKPGGHLLAFGAPRNWHRMACAIEDAGFEIRDNILELFSAGERFAPLWESLTPLQQDGLADLFSAAGAPGALAWLYGSGMPKSHKPGEQIDREMWDDTEWERGERSTRSVFWDQFGSALKPAWEPIIVARKPFPGTIAGNVLAYGTGALNIDGCRISATAGEPPGSPGRWPANVVHDGSADVQGVFDAFGTNHGAAAPANGPCLRGGNDSVARGHFNGLPSDRAPAFHGDIGSAARFFYSGKASAEDRMGSKHPTVKPIELMRWLLRLVTPPGGTVLDPFAGSGTTGMAAMAEGFDAILIEQQAEFVADIRRRIAHVEGADTPLFAAKRA